MKHFDRRIWNMSTLPVMLVECCAAFNIDFATSSVPLLMNPQLISWAFTIATISATCGYLASGYLVDHLGTKIVQIGGLIVVLLSSIFLAVGNSGVVLASQGLRYGACSVVITATVVQTITLLKEKNLGDQMVEKGLMQLQALAAGAAALGAWIGPWLLTEHRHAWQSTATVITAGVLLVAPHTKQVNRPITATMITVEGLLATLQRLPRSLLHLGVMKIVFPLMGIAVCIEAVTVFLLLDVGIRNGSVARVAFYVTAAAAGWIIPSLRKIGNKRKIGDKEFILITVPFMAISIVMIYLSEKVGLVGLILSAILLSLGSRGINTILQVRSQSISSKKGRAASTLFLVWSLGNILGSAGWGSMRPLFGMESWLLLIPVLVLTLIGFWGTFRYWEK